MTSSSRHWSSILHPQLFLQLDLAFGLWQTRSNTGVPSWPPPYKDLGISVVPLTYLEGAIAEQHEQGLVSLHPLQEEQGWLSKVIYAGQVTSLGEKGLCKSLGSTATSMHTAKSGHIPTRVPTPRTQLSGCPPGHSL